MTNQDIRDHYIYVWYIEDTGDIFYVGKGRNDRYKNKSHRSDEFKRILNSNRCNVKILFNELNNEEACALEKEIIQKCKKAGHKLTNKTDGGESGNYFKKWSEEDKRYLREQTGKKNPNYGHYWTEDMKREASERTIGRYKLSDNPNAKRIMCVESGEVFDCITEAMKKYNVKYGASFTVAIDNPNRTAAKLHWISVSKD